MQTEQLFEQEQPALEISTISSLALFDTNKAGRLSFAEDVVSRLRDEQADPLKVHICIKAMEEIISTFTVLDEKKNKNPWIAKEYRELLLSAAEKNGKKFMFNNAEFSIKEVGASYDFSKCDDSELTSLLALQEDIKAKVESRKTFLKALPLSGMEILDKETGEMFTIYPPSKSSTTAVSVSLK